MTDDRLDLSPLAPGDDGGRWEANVAATLLRVDAILANRVRREDILTLIARWRRPLLAGVALVIATLIPVEFLLERREQRAELVRDLAQLSTRTLDGEQRPTGADLRVAIGRIEVLR